MLGFRAYLDTLCPGGCGQPRDKAHHWDQDGWYEAEDDTVCHACTARARAEQEGSDEPVKPVRLIRIVDTRDYDAKPLPPDRPVKPKNRRGGR